MNNYATQHSVIVCFYNFVNDLDDLHKLEDKLHESLMISNAGVCDGHEIAMDSSHGSVYMYGPNAEVLFKTVKPILEEAYFMRKAIAVLRFGNGNGAKEIEVELR